MEVGGSTGGRAPGASRWAVALGVAAAALGAAFALAILLFGDGRVLLHEVAGGVLLIVTMALLLASARLDAARARRRALAASLLAFAVLLAMGATGAALATGALGASWDRLPLAILGIYALLALASARFAGAHA